MINSAENAIGVRQRERERDRDRGEIKCKSEGLFTRREKLGHEKGEVKKYQCDTLVVRK